MSDPYNEPREPQEDDEELLTRETPDHQSNRIALYTALKDTRGEPGLSIKDVASQIMNAFSREEVQALTNQLNKNLDA